MSTRRQSLAAIGDDDAEDVVIYQIRLGGPLDEGWSAWFDGLAIANLAGGEATLTGVLPDQAALHGVLMKVRDLGLPLLAINRLTGAAGGDGGVSSPGTETEGE